MGPRPPAPAALPGVGGSSPCRRGAQLRPWGAWRPGTVAGQVLFCLIHEGFFRSTPRKIPGKYSPGAVGGLIPGRSAAIARPDGKPRWGFPQALRGPGRWHKRLLGGEEMEGRGRSTTGGGGQGHPPGRRDNGGSNGGEPPTGAPPPRGGPPPTHGRQSTHSRRRATSATPLAIDPQGLGAWGALASSPPHLHPGNEPLGFSVSAAASPQCAQGSQAASGQGRPRGAALPPNMISIPLSFCGLRGPWLASGAPVTLFGRPVPRYAFPRSRYTAGLLCTAGPSAKTNPPALQHRGDKP